jgi:serine/threonine protein kinase
MSTIQSNGGPAPLPEQFGHYRILKLLGQGGMGSVYLAEDTQRGRRVALKVPHLTATDGPTAVQRFYREARAAATLGHPNLCAVYDVGSHDGIPYLTMAYVEGQTLAQRLKGGRPLPLRQAIAIVHKMALALQEAHAKGVTHRDLKPANVMFDQRGEPIVMDLGLARLSQQEGTQLTQQGVMMGTPAYTAPEQVRGDVEAMGPGCDIYSLGVILYELLTGRVPFEGGPPSALRGGLDPRLEAVCLKALSKEVAARYASMAELAAALAECLGPPAAGPTEQDERDERSWAWWLAGCGGLVALLTLGAVLVGRYVAHQRSQGAGQDQGTPEQRSDDPLIRGMKFVRVPKGTFWMSAPNGGNARKLVTIEADFELAAYTVTQEQWQTVMGNNPSWFSRQGQGADQVKDISDAELKRFPAEMVSWDDVQEFLKKLNAQQQGRGWLYRLPSEAEWEYACRGAATTKEECSFDFYFDKPTNDLSWNQANFRSEHPAGNGAKGPWLQRTTEVGSYAPNKLGLYDMNGNVWQWCADLYSGGPGRVLRGGSWDGRGFHCRVASRRFGAPSVRNHSFGFRLSRVPSDGK